MRKLTLVTLTLITLFVSFSAYAQNKVLSLDGDGDYVEIVDSQTLKIEGSLTIETWIYPLEVENWHQIIAKGDVVGGQDPYFVRLEGSNILFRIWAPSPEGWKGYSVKCTNSDNLLANWTFVSCVFDADNRYMKIYLNGHLSAETLVPEGANTGTDRDMPICIGAIHGSQLFIGQVDEARIWNLARTQEQIQATMNTTLTGNEEGLVAYWNFDDGTANDLTANNNDGTLNGDANIVDQYYVSPSGNDANEGSKEDPFRTIQYAIDQSGRGDVITALPGTYEENITLVGDLTLQGSGAETTIITASSGNVVSASNVHNVTLAGFTIDGQETADNGILCSGSTSEMEIRNNTITNATWGIYCTDSAKTLIEGNRIEQNIGYGILCGGTSEVRIESNKLENNQSSGIVCLGKSVEIINNQIHKNGHIGIKCFSNVVATIRYNKVEENKSVGIQLRDSSKGDISLNTIDNNSDHGIDCGTDNIAKIDNNIIYGNGIYVRGTSYPVIIRNIIHDYGVGCHDSSNPIIGGSLENANFFDNLNSAVINYTDKTINATYNYWGTDDESEIADKMINEGEGSIIFKPFIGDPELIGNVSGTGGITAYDAALILQYVVGLIDEFPANIASIGGKVIPRNRTISIPNLSVKTKELISVPILIDETSDLVAGGVTIKYDTTALKATGIKVTPESLLNNNTYWQSNIDNGEIRLAFTKTYLDEANQSNMLAMLEFEPIGNVEGITTDLVINHAQITESIAIAKVDGHITFLPSKTLLLQNYPNPFNPETWIPFKLSDNANVVIYIYDIGGQLIRKLELGKMPAGMYVSKDKAVYWDGCNQSGEKVSSGIYFYTLQAEDYSATRRMLILK